MTATTAPGPSELDQLQQKMKNTKIADEKNGHEEPNSSEDHGHNVLQDGSKVMLVAAKSRVKQVAGSIARTIRDNSSAEPPLLSAVGAASVNQAVKSIAVARDFLEEDDVDVSVELEKKPQGDVKDVIVFKLTKHKKGTLIGDLEKDKENSDGVYQDMRSATQSTPGALAGAIAKNVREGKRPRITAIGAKPVFRAISAIIIARRYLKKENMDVDMVPKFTQVKFENGTDANAVQLVVIGRQTK